MRGDDPLIVRDLRIGAYLVIMMLVAQGLAYAGGEFAHLVQAGFLALAGAVALAVLPVFLTMRETAPLKVR